MAGKYTSFEVRTGDDFLSIGTDEKKEETKKGIKALRSGFGSLRGRTHGCSCCSCEETVSVSSLKDHIFALESELRISKILMKLMTVNLINGRKGAK